MRAAVINWEALSAAAGGAVFLATLILAVATWLLARSAKLQSDAAERQAVASAELADIARRQLAVTSNASLKVLNPSGPPLSGPASDGFGNSFGVQLLLLNSGESPANIESCKLILPGTTGVRETHLPKEKVEPSQRRAIGFEVAPETARQALDHGGEWEIQIVYHDAGSTAARLLQVWLKAKPDQERRSVLLNVVRDDLREQG